ncbi:hypothetical protein N8001_00960, partial [Gammaproteobacteria bacterium]|nr:hypothetical protein [Gammaproteobacteria bacterium]
QQAAQHGADVRTYTECVALEEGKGHWIVTLREASSVPRRLSKPIVLGMDLPKSSGRSQHANLNPSL